MRVSLPLSNEYTYYSCKDSTSYTKYLNKNRIRKTPSYSSTKLSVPFCNILSIPVPPTECSETDFNFPVVAPLIASPLVALDGWWDPLTKLKFHLGRKYKTYFFLNISLNTLRKCAIIFKIKKRSKEYKNIIKIHNKFNLNLP